MLSGDGRKGLVMELDFEALLQNSPNPYVILDHELTIVWMNEAYLRATMRSRSDIIGRGMFDAFPSEPGSDSHTLLAKSLNRVLSTGEQDEIALIRYDIARPDGSMDVRFWSATNSPVVSKDESSICILQHTVDVSELQMLRGMRDEMGLVERASAVQARNRGLADESRRLKEMFEQAPGFVAVLSSPQHEFQMTNEAFQRLVGLDDLLGRELAEVLPAFAEQGFVDKLDTVFRTGEAYMGKREKVLLGDGPSAEASSRFLNFIFQPVTDDEKKITSIIIQGYDTTEEVEYEERQSLLISELNHRVKNTLAIVQGLARQSFRSVEGAEAGQKIFDARLKALAAAHTLLTEGSWSASPLAEIVTRAAEATTGSLHQRFTIDGPDVSLPPQIVLSLAMIVHELGTNAIKYGALSRNGGHVHISWTVEGEPSRPVLCFIWQETGGPEVEPPSTQGFGTRLIQRGMSGDAHSVQLLFEPGGLRCIIRTDLKTDPD